MPPLRAVVLDSRRCNDNNSHYYMIKTPPSSRPNRSIQGAPAGQGTARAPDAPFYASADLFHGGDRIWIEHNGERYSLRITRQRKLILTK
jgi:hemin uptake protein HemP